MFQEILFGQTRNPSKIFPNIFINIGDMGAEIIWRPLTARRRFMTKIFPHPLVYTLTLHWIHPLYTFVHSYSLLGWHSNIYNYKMWMYVHRWRVHWFARHAKYERSLLTCAFKRTTCKMWTDIFPQSEGEEIRSSLVGRRGGLQQGLQHLIFPRATPEICSLLCFYNRSYFQSTNYTDDVVGQLFRPKFCWWSLRGKFCMDKNPAQTFPGQFHKMSHKICDTICKSRHI